jgi:uncharacterized repeat protein (TIGR01451 family)
MYKPYRSILITAAIGLVAAIGLLAIVIAVNADEAPIDLAVDAWKDQTVEPGATIDYHVSSCNYDPSFSTSNVVLTVTLPAASTFVTSTMDDAPYPPSSRSGARSSTIGRPRRGHLQHD